MQSWVTTTQSPSNPKNPEAGSKRTQKTKGSRRVTLHFGMKSVSDILRGRRPLTRARPEATDHQHHLDAGVDWLLASIRACGGEASSKGYRIGRGWMPPYPETTGYIIPTLLNVAERRGDPEIEATARRMGAWLTGIQRPDGGFSGYELGLQEAPDVFDTGMILLGFNALLLRGETDQIARAAARAATFLQDALDSEGAFRRHVSHGMLHSYNVRSAWALVAYGKLAGDAAALSAGLANVDWTLVQQRDNGFFDNNAFKPGGNANTHGIAYVLRGLLQVHALTGRTDCLVAVRSGADRVVELVGRYGWLAAEIGPDWSFRSSHICLTGCAQLAIVLLRLASLTGEAGYVAPAERLIALVAATQDTRARGARHYGAIAGSYPIFGAYAPLQYPNWATKFFVDALLLRAQWQNGDRAFREGDLYAG